MREWMASAFLDKAVGQWSNRRRMLCHALQVLPLRVNQREVRLRGITHPEHTSPKVMQYFPFMPPCVVPFRCVAIFGAFSFCSRERCYCDISHKVSITKNIKTWSINITGIKRNLRETMANEKTKQQNYRAVQSLVQETGSTTKVPTQH